MAIEVLTFKEELAAWERVPDELKLVLLQALQAGLTAMTAPELEKYTNYTSFLKAAKASLLQNNINLSQLPTPDHPLAFINPLTPGYLLLFIRPLYLSTEFKTVVDLLGQTLTQDTATS